MTRLVACMLLVLSASALGDDAADCRAKKGTWKDDGRERGCIVSNKREGVWELYGPGGQLVERTTFKASRRDGPSTTWFLNCKVRAKGDYAQGQRTGLWKEFDVEGNPVSEGSYDKGLRTGEWTTYYRGTPRKHLVGPFARDRQNGRFTEYFVTGEKWRELDIVNGERQGEAADACRAKGGVWQVEPMERTEGCLEAGVKEGVWTTYHLTGAVKSKEPFKKGRIDGIVEEFHLSGALLHRGLFRDAVPDGRHEFLAPDGGVWGKSVLVEQSGEWRPFHHTGKVATEGAYDRGCPVGPWRVYSEQGQLLVEDTYANCQRNGPYTDYYLDGSRRRSGEFKNGVEVGPWVQRFENGKVAWEGTYAQGERIGGWKFFRWDGSLRMKGQYEGGEATGTWTESFADGKTQAVGPFIENKKGGDWKLYWQNGKPWREAPYVEGDEATPDAVRCREMAGNWTADVEKGALGCLICRAKEDETVEWLPQGRWSFWHADGTLEKRGELRWGKPTGAWEYFHDNGAVMLEGQFDGGVEVGGWKGFYRSGQTRFVGGYVEGKPDGEWTSYQPDGGLLSVGRYEGGQKVGRWKYASGAKVDEVVHEKRSAPDAGAEAAAPDAGR